MPPPAPVTQTDRPAREGSFRLVHRDKVRNTTLAFKTPKLGFTLGLWKDGWIRVQRVAQTCPHFLALAPGDALRVDGKRRQRYTKTGIIKGRTVGYKKAIVSLAEGEMIDFYENI